MSANDFTSAQSMNQTFFGSGSAQPPSQEQLDAMFTNT
jgi:hypothetical protein